MEDTHKVVSSFTDKMKKDRFLLSFLINELIAQVPDKNIITSINTEVTDSKKVIVIRSIRQQNMLDSRYFWWYTNNISKK